MDLDIGSRANGTPVVVFNRCPPVGPEGSDSATGCTPRMLELPARNADSAIPGVPAGTSTRAFAIWKGTFVWAEGAGSSPVVNRLQPTGRLHRVRVQPTTLCSSSVERRICRRTDLQRVLDLDLRGDLLAASFRYHLRGQYGFATAALWLTNVRTGRRSEVGTVVSGLAGQSFVGPQFVNRRTLGYLLTCPDDYGGCSHRFGEYRLDLRTRRTTFRRDQVPHAGWGAVAAGLLLTPSAPACPGGATPLPGVGPCTVQLVSSPRFASAPAPKLERRR